MPAIMKPSRVASAIQTEAVRGGNVTTFTAFALFDFAEPRRLLTEQALWPMVVEQMPKGAIFDKGQLKPKGELIVVGSALAPGDQPIAGIRVTARLGAIEKQLAVFGDRFWRMTDRGIEMLPARPFDRMPIDAAHAFGGSNHKTNPAGKGHGARQIAETGYDAPLPNVEDARRLIKSIDDNPVPAHFGPLAPDDAQRLRHMGTYDQHWIKHVSPLKPDDFNPLFHNDAPDDQRIDAYFKGDETFAVFGMSRGETVVAGQLPNLRARAFVHRPADGSFTEVKMVCDTVTLFPNVNKATLAFRGIAKGQERFGADIGTVMYAFEHAEAEPRPADHYLGVFRLRSDPEQAHKYALADYQLMPEVDPAIVSERRRARLEQAQADRIRFLENQNWLARKELEDEGMPPSLVPTIGYEAAFGDLPLVAMPSAEEIERGDFDLAATLDDMETLNKAIRLKADEQLALAELQRRALVETTPAALLPAFALKPIVDDEHIARFPGLVMPDELAAALADVDETLGSAKDTALAGVKRDYEGSDRADELVAEIEKSFAMLEGPMPLDDAKVEEQFRLACARALKLPEGSLLHEVRSAISGLDTGNLELGDPASLREGIPQEFLDVVGRSFDKPKPVPQEPGFDSEALLGRNHPDQPDDDRRVGALARAEDAVRKMMPNLVKPDGEDNPIAALMATVKEMVPREPDLNVAGQPVTELVASRTQTAISQIDAMEPDLEDSLATGRLHSPGASFPLEPFVAGVAERFGRFIVEKLAEGQDFKGADLAGADLRGVDFSGLDLAGTFFENADLTGASFAGANLNRAVFAGAKLDDADLSDTDLTKANLSKASLREARLSRAVLDDCTIIQSDLTRLSADSATLKNIRLLECTVDEADFSHAVVSDLQFVKGTANGLRMAGARIERASIMALPIAGADFSGAALERVAFMQIAAAGPNFSNARMKTVGFLGDCDLSGGRWEALVAEECSWNTSKMQESCFLRASCTSCFFNSCEMEGADFRLASLRSSLLQNSRLADSDFFAANLFSASLMNADLRRASLRGANLYGANLVDAKLASCDLSGANLSLTLLEQPSHA